MKVGYVMGPDGKDNNLIVNPSEEEMSLSSLNLVVSSTKDKVVMI
jgi:polyribonucleotide nucleotidyltransferase